MIEETSVRSTLAGGGISQEQLDFLEVSAGTLPEALVALAVEISKLPTTSFVGAVHVQEADGWIAIAYVHSQTVIKIRSN